MTNGKSNKIKSTHIRFGARTYFFDVNQAENNKKYLKITESKFNGEGKERTYNSFFLLPDDIKEFQRSLLEVSASLGE
jgi:hypothetical protein